MYFRAGGRDERKRYECNYSVTQKYLVNKCNNREIASFFKERNINKIAIYGVNDLAKCMINDLANTDVEISCIIDRAASNFPNGCKGIRVIEKSELSSYKDIDVIVIAVLYEINDILDGLEEEGISLDNVISITDVVYSL